MKGPLKAPSSSQIISEVRVSKERLCLSPAPCDDLGFISVVKPEIASLSLYARGHPLSTQMLVGTKSISVRWQMEEVSPRASRPRPKERWRQPSRKGEGWKGHKKNRQTALSCAWPYPGHSLHSKAPMISASKHKEAPKK